MQVIPLITLRTALRQPLAGRQSRGCQDSACVTPEPCCEDESPGQTNALLGTRAAEGRAAAKQHSTAGGATVEQEESKPLTALRSACKAHRRKLAAVGGLVLLALALWQLSPLGPAPAAVEGFIKVAGVQFEHQCRPFFVAGFNVDNIAQAPVARAGRKLEPGEPSGRAKVRQLLREAAAAGLNVMRTWAHTSDPKREYPLQEAPGRYREDVFRGLDYAIDQARRAGIKVVLSLIDNWHYYGGVDEYVDWSKTVPRRNPRYPRIAKLGDASPEDYSEPHRQYEERRHALFFNDTSCRLMYKAHASAVLERRNVYNGLLYKDDPTILAWDLVNELRCSAREIPDCPRLVSSWLTEMAAFVKSIDAQHLVTIGSDGFWGSNSSYAKSNPSEWASQVGQDFFSNHATPGIDFAAIHLWPQQWENDDPEFSVRWLRDHIEETAEKLKKPLLLEEFGKMLGRGQEPPESVLSLHRNPVFRAVYNLTEAAIARQEPVVGSLFWRWAFMVYNNDIPGPHGIMPHQSTFNLVREHAHRLRRYAASRPPSPGCQPTAAGCWMPESGLGGFLRRCTNQPAVCAEHWDPENLHRNTSSSSSILVGPGSLQVYLSWWQCCQAGLGAFSAGCTAPW